MKVSVAQINTTPGDFYGNANLIRTGIKKAAEEGSRLVVFPELTLCGYAVRDLMFKDGFVHENNRWLHDLAQFCAGYPDLYVVVGYIDANRTGSGKPFRNMAAVIKDGTIIATYQKQLRPFYDVFDEGRYFEPGHDLTIINIDGFRCGVTICEDLWNDKGQEDYNHHMNPISDYRAAGVDTIINLSSSPYNRGKPAARRLMVKEICTGGIKNLVYANQYGAQDELVFDGHSMIARNCNVAQQVTNTIYPKPLDTVDLITVDLATQTYINTPIPYVDFKDHLAMVILGLRDYAAKIGMKEFVVGSSGGIDSAVVIALAAMAFGGQNVHAIKMPSKWSSDHSVADAVKLHKAFGVNDYTVKIDHEPWLDSINKQLGFVKDIEVPEELKDLNLGGEFDGNEGTERVVDGRTFIWYFGAWRLKDDQRTVKQIDYNSVADENIQARQRGQVVMHYSNATGALPLTTGNKTELALGYCTLYGDMNGGFNPIGDLYKLEVYEVAKVINEIYHKEMIPENIIAKAPSAELAPGQTDEASLLPYPVLDFIIQAYVEDYVEDWQAFRKWAEEGPNHRLALLEWVKDDNNKGNYDRMIRRVDIMEYKRRQAAPCTRVTKKAFGTGRRLPIVKRGWR